MAKALRVFLDANILFSACRPAGAIRQLLQQLEEQGHILVADHYVAAEARRNLEAKEGAFAVDVLDALLARIEVAALQPSSTVPAGLDWLVEKDRPVLLAAIALKCNVLVTGDKTHFGIAYGQTHHGVAICSPAQLFNRL